MSSVQGTKITIRPIAEQDVDSVLALGRSLLKREDIIVPPPSEGASFVAESEGRVVGYILARNMHLGIPLSKICVICGIIVDRQYRGHGIGQQLVTALSGYCEKEDVKTIRASVDETDVILRKFVEELGFQRSPVNNYDRIQY
jgi:ribosomal protein S18 acetylase RimI-like enzyme